MHTLLLQRLTLPLGELAPFLELLLLVVASSERSLHSE